MAEYKYQWNETRTFGVEIECVIKRGISRQMLASTLMAEAQIQLVDLGGYSHTYEATVWEMKTDGSIMDSDGTPLGSTGRNLEIVSPVLCGREGLEQVVRVVKVLRGTCNVNKSCGLHVHHGVPDLTSDSFCRLYQLYRLNQRTIDMLVTPSRRDNHFAHWLSLPVNRLPAKTLEARVWARRVVEHEGRYTVVNFDSYVQRGTVEFRQHHATLDHSKVVAWVVFTQACIEFALRGEGRKVLDYWELSSFSPINGLAWRVGIDRRGDGFEAKQYRRLCAAFDLQVRNAGVALVWQGGSGAQENLRPREQTDDEADDVAAF